MFIVPFTHSVVNNNNFEVNVIKLLTIGGKQLWEEKSTLHIDNDILNPNDIYRKSPVIKYDKNLQLCEVDIEKTNISDFYKWEEVSINDSETFCWKTFYYFTGNNKLSWLEVPDNEKIGRYNIGDLIKTIIQEK
jgi:hypothetical protein